MDTPPTLEGLQRRIRQLEDLCQEEHDKRVRAEDLIRGHNADPRRKGRGLPVKPKKKGQVDAISVKQATKDASKSAVGGTVVMVGAAAKYLGDWYKEGGGTLEDAIAQLDKLGPWAWIVGLFVLGHWFVNLAIKANEEYK